MRKEKVEADWYERSLPSKDSLEQGKIYISKEFETSIHLCMCGCGFETVLPLKNGMWNLSEKDGKVTITPSIQNPFPCNSHYVITDGIANFV